MACQMRDCAGEHGGIHFRLHADTSAIIDMLVTSSSFVLRDRHVDAAVALGNNDSILAAVYEGQVPDLIWSETVCPANMRWVPRPTAPVIGGGMWYLDYNKRAYALPNIPPCILAATEMHKTSRPGKPGFTSVLLDGVPIKESYEFTGTGLVTTGGQS